MIKWIFSILLIVIGVFAYAFFGVDQTVSVKELRRNDSVDLFLTGEQGSTRFRTKGEGETVILIHAFNGYLETWKPNIEPLVAAGYKVVSYDLWGRGLSDRPFIKYELADFRNQLHEIVKMSGGKSVHLIGSSFGSVIAADYATHYPDLVSKVVFMGPAGWPGDNKAGVNLLDFPVVPEVVFNLFGKQILEPIVSAYFREPSKHQWAIDGWTEYASLPSLGRVALSTMRNSPVRDFTNGWLAFGKLNKPSIFIWGKQDVSFPFENSIKAKEFIPNTRIVEVDDAAHWVNIEKPDIVNGVVIEFLGSR